MISRALFLQKAIDTFVGDDDINLYRFKLTEKEWSQARIVATILLPFKKISTKLQKTSSASIDSVFWAYESLFNRIDSVKATLVLPVNQNQDWVEEVHEAVDRLASKLRKHYTKTKHCFVYPDAVILEPRGKLTLLKQDTFEDGYAEKCQALCRKRFVDCYQSLQTPHNPSSTSSWKRKRYELESDDDDDYRRLLHKHAAKSVENEFDRYLQTPPPAQRCTALEWWKLNCAFFPALSQMARDTFSVPATSAGVEREFSKSGRVATWTRAALNPITITETMIYKNHLARAEGTSIQRSDHKIRSERVDDEGDSIKSDGDSEERSALITWEKEWWQKVETVIQL